MERVSWMMLQQLHPSRRIPLIQQIPLYGLAITVPEVQIIVAITAMIMTMIIVMIMAAAMMITPAVEIMIMAAIMMITPAAETTIMAVVMMAAAIIPAEMTPVAIPGLMTAETQIQEQVQKRSNQETE